MSIRQLAQVLLEERRALTSQLGPDRGSYEFRARVSALRKRGVLKEDTISFRALLETCMASKADPFGERCAFTYARGMAKYERDHTAIFEAIDAVGASTFADIGGQLMVDRVRDNYELAMAGIDQLATVRPNPVNNLGPHIDPWLSRVYEEPQIVEPGQPFPWAHFSEQWATLPAPEKRTFGLALEMEMIMADKTRQAMLRANGVGEKMGLNKAKRLLATMTGMTFTMGNNVYSPHEFEYNGTSYALYNTSGLWVNQVSGLVVTNYNNVTTIEQLFGHMTDLATGDPIEDNLTQRIVLCTWDKQWDLYGAFTATDNLRGAFPTSGDNIQGHFPSPLPKTNSLYKIVPSKLLYNMLVTGSPTAPTGTGNLSSSQAKDYLIWGDLPKAFGYREVYPITIIQAPPQNPAEFYQDIALQVKCTEYGVPFVDQPQSVAMSYND